MNSKTITLCNHKNPLLPNSISLSTLNHEHISLPFPPKRRRPRHSTQFRVSSDGFSCNRLSRSLRLASNRFFSRIQESVQTETGFDFDAAASGFAQRAKEAEDDFKRFFGLEFLSLKHWKWDDPNLIPANVTFEVSELFTRELTREVDEIMKGLSPAMFEDFVKPFQINSNERNMEVKISPSINTFHLPRVTPRFTFPFNRRIKKVVVKTKAMREWQEYEDALKRKDLATALSFLIKNNKNYYVAVVDKVNDDVNRVGDFGLGFKGWKSDRDWDVLDTCLNADDMRLVAKAYSFLCNRGFLPNFGKFTNIVLEGPREVTPKVLQSSTGLEVTKFAPKKWGLSGVSNFVLAAFLAGASYLTWQGVDVRPNLAAILGLAFVDSIFLGGTCLAQISSYWPPYRCRILVHEAGHLLVAYLMGCPIRGVILDPIVAMQMGIQGQAGTQFWDEKLNNELAEGRLTSTTFDRYCMVLFAGIAAEALVYGVAEGGENDENLFRSISVLLHPPPSVNQMSNQARWSVLQSYNLLKWHRHAHRAAFKALENGSSLSVVIRKIEEAMSSSE